MTTCNCLGLETLGSRPVIPKISPDIEWQAMFKIEVLNALQIQIWPSKIYLSHNNPSYCNPELKMKTSSLEFLDIICPPQEPTDVRVLSRQEVELDG